jgi:hypothetical protein
VIEENSALGSLVTYMFHQLFVGCGNKDDVVVGPYSTNRKKVSVYQFLVEIPEMMNLIRGRSN